MMSLRRIFGLMLLFLFFEAVVAIVTTIGWPDTNPFLACLGMTGLAVGVCAIILLIGRLTSRPRAAQPPSPVRPVAAARMPVGDAGFGQEFTSLLKEADRRLATALPANGKPRRTTALPLYLLIGSEDSGKTSAILNAGVDPILLAGESSRDGRVVPTRLCNLWLADKSVFADISGRVLMQEAEHWEQSLRLLGGQQPIPKWKRMFVAPPPAPSLRGVMLFCDANTFVRASDPARTAAFARTLNERLQTVGTVFRNEFPVYVVFNKADAVQDFGDFFYHLNDAEERRVLGVTLPLARAKSDSAETYSETENKRLTGYFNRLCLSLSDKRIVLLAREDDPKRRAKAYEFPRELRKTRADSVRFLLDVFRPSAAQQSFRLRGFYFSGQRLVSRSRITSDATGTDFFVAPSRMDATGFLDAKTNTQQQSSLSLRGAQGGVTVTRSIFLTELFRNILFKDRASYTAAPPDLGDQTRRNLIFGAVGAVLLLFSLLLAYSWRQNRRVLDNVRSAVDGVERNPLTAPTVDNLARLDQLRASLAELQQYQRAGAPWSYRWGLYAGDDVLPASNRLYLDRFRHIFLDPVLAAWTSHFRSLRPNSVVDDDVYGSLKSYRMLTAQACKPDEVFLNPTLMSAWTTVTHPSPDASALAQRQVEFYTAQLKVRDPFAGQLAEDSAAVTQAQDYLKSMNGPEKIFRGLLEQVNRDEQRDTLGNYAANYGEVLSGPDAVDGAYTRSGWNSMISRIHSRKFNSLGDPCVIGGGGGVASLSMDAIMQRDVETLYTRNYVSYWKSFLAAHHVIPFGGIPDGTRKLHTLADNNRSPLLALVYMASHNTDVASTQPAETKVVQTLEQMTSTARKGIGTVLERFGAKKSRAESGSGTVKTVRIASYADVTSEFEPVHAMVDPNAPDKWLNTRNQEYIQALELLSEALAALPARPDPKVQTDQEAVNNANKAAQNAETTLHTLTGSFVNTRSQVDVNLKALLAEPIRYSDELLRRLPGPLPTITPYDVAATVQAAVPPPPPPPVAPGSPPPDLTIPVKEQVNKAAVVLCTSLFGLRSKYPFDLTAAEEASSGDLNEVFAPVTGTLAQFVHTPDVSKIYQQQGRAWVANPAFPATFSQPFLVTLNSLEQFSDELYADGGNNPHFEYTVSLDGTGKVPFELDVDGHVISYSPKKPSAPVRLQWPPLTGAATKLVLKTGLTLPAQSAGPWSFFRLLQAADDQTSTLYTFRTIQFAGSKHVPIQDGKGNPVTIQIRFDSPVANIFTRGYFSRMHCEGWVVR